MDKARKRRSKGFHGGRRRGFTLVELIVALTVVSVAMSVLIAMFGSSLNLAGEARNRVLAAEIAEAHLAAMLATPEQFLWHVNDPDASGLFPVTLTADDPQAGNPVNTPEVRLAARGAQDRNTTLYRQFRWQGWGRLPSPDAQVYEITVSVGWRAQGRNRTMALTGAISRHLVENAPIAPPEEGGSAS